MLLLWNDGIIDDQLRKGEKVPPEFLEGPEEAGAEEDDFEDEEEEEQSGAEWEFTNCTEPWMGHEVKGRPSNLCGIQSFWWTGEQDLVSWTR